MKIKICKKKNWTDINITNINPISETLIYWTYKWEVLYKSIDIYYIGYITMKDFHYVKINTVDPLYLIIGKADGCT